MMLNMYNVLDHCVLAHSVCTTTYTRGVDLKARIMKHVLEHTAFESPLNVIIY